MVSLTSYMDTLGNILTNTRNRVVNSANEPTMIEISTRLGTYTPQASGRYWRDSEVAIIRKRYVYMPMLMAIDKISMGTNEVLNRVENINSGATAQNRIISQYSGA